MEKKVNDMVKREVEFQKLLTDERLRAEQHKVNYQVLKAEHGRLNEEFGFMQKKLQEITVQKQQDDEQHLVLVKHLEKEALEANTVIENLQSQILTPQKIDILQNEIQAELLQRYSDVIKRAEEEATRYGEKYRNLYCTFTALQTENEQVKMDLERSLMESHKQNEIEIYQLKNQWEVTEKRYLSQNKHRSEKIKAMDKENVYLKQQLDNVQRELQDTRQKESDCCSKYEDDVKELSQKLNEFKVKFKSVEMEKSTLGEMNQILNEKIARAMDENSTLKLELSDSRGNVTRLKIHVDSVEEKFKLETLNHQVELQKRQDEWEKQSEDFSHIIKRLKLRLEMADTQNFKKIEVEENLTRQLQSLKMKENSTIDRIHTENADLQNQLSATKKLLLEKEESLYRSKKESTELADEFQKKEKSEVKLKTELSECQRQVEMLLSDIKMMNEAEKNLILRNKELNKVLRSVKRRISKTPALNVPKIVSRLKRKIGELEKSLKITKVTSKHKMKKYKKLIVKLRNKLEIQKAHMQGLTIEKESLKCGVPHEIHQLIKKKLYDLQQRNETFKKALNLHEENQVLSKIWLVTENNLKKQQRDHK